MKYFIGFLAGVIFTTIVFTFILRKKADVGRELTETASDYAEENESLPPDFLAFYQRFHEDSLYQLEHILFPLQGIPSNADSAAFAGNNFRWQRENWVMHHPFENAQGSFSRSLKKITDEMVIENITVGGGQYGMQRRFSKFGDDWMLIYYVGMNKLAKEE